MSIQYERARRVRAGLSISQRTIAAAAVLACSSCALAQDAYLTYGSAYRSVTLPPVGSGSFDIKGDVLPDGRIIAATGGSIYLERGAGSGLFDAVGTLDAGQIGAGVDPGFLAVSPDGLTVALGGGFGKPVVVFAVGSLGTPGAPAPLSTGVANYFDVPHYEAAWADNSRLALTAGDFGSASYVSLLDVTSGAGSPVNPVIISNIAGSSAGIAFDAAGNLYTGNGFDLDGLTGSTTGTIRAFSPADWAGGGVGAAANFETQGSLIGEVLSAGSLNFDLEGNLFVGGGDFGSDSGYLGIVHSDAIAAALAGMGEIDPNDPADLRRLDPLGSGFGYFGSVFDESTGQLFITSGSTWYATVPTPACAMLSLLGLAATRRRRCAS